MLLTVETPEEVLKEWYGSVVKTGDTYGRLLACYEDVLVATSKICAECETGEYKDKPVTYCSECCTELPWTWDQSLWLDDSGRYQRICQIDFELYHEARKQCVPVKKPCFVMEDGSRSWNVTEVK